VNTATIEDVQARLPQILDALAPGDEVVITRNGAPVGRLVRPSGAPAHSAPSRTNTDPLDVGARIEALKLLKNGWLDGKGLAPPPDGLDWFAGVFGRYFPDDLPLPYIYPTAEGRVRTEWSVGQHELSLNVDLNTRIGAWHSLNLGNDTDLSRELHLNEAGAWEWLIDELRRLVGAST
jgi:antitoxin (DNA-binding transcriptional repressor) of toxin-antitoxin stability system